MIKLIIPIIAFAAAVWAFIVAPAYAWGARSAASAISLSSCVMDARPIGRVI